MKKISKIIIIITFIAVTVLSIGSVIVTNYHHIYVFGETQGFFKTPLQIKNRDANGFGEYSLEELKKDSRVSFDQSLMLINTKHTLKEDFVPDVLEYKDTTVYMSRCMIEAYAALSAAVNERTEKKLYVSSDLRSAEEQEALYAEDPLTATLPGASEHQTGLALDVYVAYYSGDGFIKSPSGRFVNSHAHEYGFIIRYPSYAEEVTGIRYEPWHIRYVGHPHSDVIYRNHITLEEYIEILEIGEWYEINGFLVSRQRIGENVTLPETFESCVISPDNTGCYIITVK